MKKFFLAVAMLFIIGGATTASAQFKFGLVAGMNMSKLSFDNGKYFDSDHRAGWYVCPEGMVQHTRRGAGHKTPRRSTASGA